MALLSFTPRRVAPYIISGVTGIHILARLRHATKQPAYDIPLHFFLLRHTDVVLTLGGTSVALWRLAQYQRSQQLPGERTTSPSPASRVGIIEKSEITGIVHQLRQVFTALLIGLGLIDRKANRGDTTAIHGLVKRLKNVVYQGIDEVNVLNADQATNGRERAYGS